MGRPRFGLLPVPRVLLKSSCRLKQELCCKYSPFAFYHWDLLTWNCHLPRTSEAPRCSEQTSSTSAHARGSRGDLWGRCWGSDVCMYIYTWIWNLLTDFMTKYPSNWLRANELTVCAGHLEVRDHPQDVVHLIGSLLSLNDAVRRRIGRVDVNHVQQVDPCVWEVEVRRTICIHVIYGFTDMDI